jgi:hypothetical protein
MKDIVLIAPPVAEPVTLSDVKLQLGFGPMQDSDRAAAQILDQELRAYIVAARQDCENWCRRVFVTQTWLLRLSGFPGADSKYNWNGYPTITLPMPPLQSVDELIYVDTFGAVQTLLQDTSYGNTSPQYGYQLARGSDTGLGRIYSSWARPWPPTRMVPSNVMVQFRCGYGGPITVSMTAGSALLTVSAGAPLTFNFDDAPLMAGDTGTRILVPGAGPVVGGIAQPLDTFIASVNPVNGQATLAAAATTAVTNVPGWAGQPVPAVLTTAIKMQVEHYYENGGGSDCELPRVVESLLGPYRNFVA